MNNSEKRTPPFVIIIPVTHSLKDLERCLTSIAKLDYPRDRFHVVLVDCRVVPGLGAFMAKIPKGEFTCRLLTLPERSLTGPSWLHEQRVNEARNFAIRTSPGECYIITEDDCTFEPAWLEKIEAHLADDVGALGGSEILPEGLGWFPRALDCLLNSFLGAAGSRSGNVLKADWYYPRKVNMAIPARILERVGLFPEDISSGAEIEIANRIRHAGFRIRYVEDNPVWHRRVTTFRKFVLRNIYIASEKVKVLRQQHTFFRSLHFLVFLSAIVVIIIGFFSLVSLFARYLFVALVGVYFIVLMVTAIVSASRTRSLAVGLGVLLLGPVHLLTVIWGVFKGALLRASVTA
ncbi:MAG: glycosyltransferase [Gemmatimonadota bacterium]|nr:MAG: glycosyltransferase [Gemmatimonadota bacterium]